MSRFRVGVASLGGQGTDPCSTGMDPSSFPVFYSTWRVRGA